MSQCLQTRSRSSFAHSHLVFLSLLFIISAYTASEICFKACVHSCVQQTGRVIRPLNLQAPEITPLFGFRKRRAPLPEGSAPDYETSQASDYTPFFDPNSLTRNGLCPALCSKSFVADFHQLYTSYNHSDYYKFSEVVGNKINTLTYTKHKRIASYN